MARRVSPQLRTESPDSSALSGYGAAAGVRHDALPTADVDAGRGRIDAGATLGAQQGRSPRSRETARRGVLGRRVDTLRLCCSALHRLVAALAAGGRLDD